MIATPCIIETEIKIWDLRLNNQVHSILPNETEPHGMVTSLHFNENLIVGYEDGSVSIIDYRMNK